MVDLVQEMEGTKLISGLALAAMMALLSWNVWATSQLTTQVAVLQERVNSVIEDSYSSSQAASDARDYNRRIERLEHWNARLSDRLADVESTIRKGIVNERPAE